MIIQETINGIKDTTRDIAESTYGTLAGDIAAGVTVFGVVGLTWIFINMLLAIVPMTGAAVAKWAFRFVIVTAAAASTTYFDTIYSILTGVPDAIAGTLLGGATIETGLDTAATVLWEKGETIMGEAGITNPGPAFQAVGVWVLAILLVGAAIVVLGVAYIGLGVSIGIAPVFIIALLSNATADLFSTWVKWALGFGMLLVVTSGIVGVIVNILSGEVGSIAGTSELAGVLNTLILSVASIFFLQKAPGYASALAGTVTTVGQSAVSVVQNSVNAGSQGMRATGSIATGINKTASKTSEAIGRIAAGGKAPQTGSGSNSGSVSPQRVSQSSATEQAAKRMREGKK